MKFCKDCKWCELETNFNDKEYQLKYARCDNPKNLIFSKLVTGKDIVKRKYKHCSTQREFSWLSTRILGICGREGRWYERSNL